MSGSAESPVEALLREALARRAAQAPHLPSAVNVLAHESHRRWPGMVLLVVAAVAVAVVAVTVVAVSLVLSSTYHPFL